MSIPVWAAPLVEKVRNAVIERPGDVDCVAVLIAAIEGMGEIELPEEAARAGVYAYHAESEHEIYPSLAAAYQSTINALAEELRGAA